MSSTTTTATNVDNYNDDDDDDEKKNNSEWNKEIKGWGEKGYKSRHDWVGKMIPWELCKRLKFVHADKLYIHKPVLKRETHKIHWHFEIQIDNQIQTPRISFNKQEEKKFSPRKFCRYSGL